MNIFDDVPIGLEVYRQADGSGYKVTFGKDSVTLSGGKYGNGRKIADAMFSNGQTLEFAVSVKNQGEAGVADSIIDINISAHIKGTDIGFSSNISDNDSTRLKIGEAGISIDLSAIQNQPNLKQIVIKSALAAKNN